MNKSKLAGITAVASIILLLLWKIIFFGFGFLFGLGSGAGIIILLPLLFITAVQMIFLGFLFLLSLKILKNQPLPIKENNTLAKTLVVFGTVYFLYIFSSVLFFNISGFNSGAWLRLISAFLWCLITVSFGMALLEKNKLDK